MSATTRSTRLAPPTTRTPASISFRAVEAPIPLDEPVTIAVFPSSTTAAAYGVPRRPRHITHSREASAG